MSSDESGYLRAEPTAAGPAPRVPSPETPPGDGTLLERLADAVTASDAPDAVFALSRHGRRSVVSGGTAPPPPFARETLRYEIGSATKTFTGLLLARLIGSGRLSGGEPATAFLDGGRPTGANPVTLAHLITHTSGLPALPAGFLLRGLPAWTTNPYGRFPEARVVDAFLRHRPRHRPGTRWRYSNYGVAVLGHALAAATGTPWEALLTDQILRPLGLNGTTLCADDSGFDALGRKRDGVSPVPAFDAGGFQAAGAVRATPQDLLTFLEAHLDPTGVSPHLAPALRAVRRPVLRRGIGHRHVHTIAWFRHPTDGGPMYFHSGATLGQQAFLGFRADTGTALAAVCTRRFRAHDPFLATAYALLAQE
ncbi:serine hydrolase domain-containing protein [Streptomyces sp. NPDC093598]|uniref:serine hydrolase domain-containing protein n=1 Tax=Streptomyces sp. NPDC093598 TaxID=3366046 RepID=UPI00382C725E